MRVCWLSLDTPLVVVGFDHPLSLEPELRLRLLTLTGAILSAALSSRADTLYNLNATLSDGLVTGSFLYNSGVFDGGSLTVTTNGTSYLLNQGFGGVAQHFDGYSFFSVKDSVGDVFFAMYVTIPGGICSETSGCGITSTREYSYFLPAGVAVANADNVVSGAVAIASTPEPSSIALLGTGMLGIAGVIRKRLA